jgi:hypothetical protein
LNAWGYLMVGLAAALPCVAVPLLLPNKVTTFATQNPGTTGLADASDAINAHQF